MTEPRETGVHPITLRDLRGGVVRNGGLLGDRENALRQKTSYNSTMLTEEAAKL